MAHKIHALDICDPTNPPGKLLMVVQFMHQFIRRSFYSFPFIFFRIRYCTSNDSLTASVDIYQNCINRNLHILSQLDSLLIFPVFAVSLRSWMSSCIVEYKAPQLTWPLWWVVSFVLMWRKFMSLGWWKLIGVDSKFTHFLPWLQQLPMQQVDKKHTWKNWICCFFVLALWRFAFGIRR